MAIPHQPVYWPDRMSVHAIIVAAGSGQRAGLQSPKQFEMLAGKPVYRWSVDTLLADDRFEAVCIVVPESSLEEVRRTLPLDKRLVCVSGGAERADSVRNGIAALEADENNLVFVHDAARPGLDSTTINLLLEALEAHDAAAPALPITDAIKRHEGGALSTIDRTNLFRIQTPQAFRLNVLRDALARSSKAYVDDLEAVEASGASVKLVSGTERLSKITFPDDFEKVRALMFSSDLPIRVGTGFDVHGFEPGPGVTLCGVFIEHGAKLKGHSDADAGWHALTDAILGAMALGDIGDHFPPSDERWKDADSGVFLRHAIELARQQGWELGNCDVTLICEAPKIKPHREAMREKTAAVTGLALDAVSIKATTTEGLGFTGRGEGIAAQAAATLRRLR